MKINKLTGLLLASLLVLLSSQASAVILTDRIDASDMQAGTFFIDGNNTADAVYRFYDQDWSWQHNSFMHDGMLVDPGDITKATLRISAFDVDDSTLRPDGNPAERDVVSRSASEADAIGELSGTSNMFSITEFDILDQGFNNDIVNGLLLHILIDQDNTSRFWRLSLEYSELEIEFTVPSEVPVPAAVWLFGTALLGLLGYGRRKNKAA